MSEFLGVPKDQVRPNIPLKEQSNDEGQKKNFDQGGQTGKTDKGIQELFSRG